MRRAAYFSVLAAIVLATHVGCQTGPMSHTQHVAYTPYAVIKQQELVATSQGPNQTFGDRFPSPSLSLIDPTARDPRLSRGRAPWPLQYAYNIGVSTSQMANTVLGGDPDESLSARFGRADQDGVTVVKYGIAPAVDFVCGPDHCRRSAATTNSHAREVWHWGTASPRQEPLTQVAKP